MAKTIQINAYSLTKLAQLFDANRETMRRRLELVKPIEKGKWTFAQVIEAYVLYEKQHLTGNGEKEALDAAYERARKDKELADKTALENQVRRGELLEVSDVKQIWSDHIASAKSGMRSLPSKLAPVVAAETDPNVVNEILLDGVDEALEELGNG
jgi:phage terminase Nu1 subunit (DNA packaging protein)